MSYVSEILADSPSIYWRMIAAAATTEEDQTANNLDGTYAGGGHSVQQSSPILTDAAAKSVYFNGATDNTTGTPRIERSNNAALQFSADFSIEFWFKIDGAVSAEKMIATKGGTSSACGNWAVQLTAAGALQFGITGNDGLAKRVTLITPSVDTWHHLVATCDVDTHEVILYIDGAQVDTDTLPGTGIISSSSTLYVGTQSSLSEEFKGWLAEFAAYPTKLTAARVLAHYEAALSAELANRMRMMI